MISDVPDISEEFLLVMRLTALLTLLALSGLMVFISARGMRRSMRSLRRSDGQDSRSADPGEATKHASAGLNVNKD
jgi:hypothetical protein